MTCGRDETARLRAELARVRAELRAVEAALHVSEAENAALVAGAEEMQRRVAALEVQLGAARAQAVET